MDKWQNKVAVVTGASAGIGAVTASTLAHHGMIVVALGRNEKNLKNLADASGGKIHVMKCDVQNENEVVNTFAEIKKRFGSVGVLVNNAGVYDTSSLSEGSTEMWRTIMMTNVMGMSLCTREALKLMDKAEGHIVNLNSVIGHIVVNAFKDAIGMYPASKHAITGLTKSLRFELRSAGSSIRVTSISPGLVHTDMGLKAASGIKIAEEDKKKGGFLSTQSVANTIVNVISMEPTVEIQEVIMQDSRISY